MLTIKKAFKKLGEQSAYAQVNASSPPRVFYEPKPPAKIQAKIDKVNKGA